MTWMTDDGGSDDVALLVYRHPVPLTLHFDADSRELKTARAALRVWLDRAGATPEVAQDVLIAAGEACANAVEHAYRDSNQDIQGDVRLTAVAVGDDVRITVSDRGIWNIGRPEGSPFRGRGRSLMRTLMREVRFLTGADGTTVEMSTRITG
jgi:anti-sigma regulatory factor (Ser/Thr protein kinase)